MSERNKVYIVIYGVYKGVGKSLDEAYKDYTEKAGESPIFHEAEWYKAEPIGVSLKEAVVQTLVEE